MHHFHGSGYVYLIRIFSFKNEYKIGFTKNILKRIRQLRRTYGDIELVSWCWSEDGFGLESKIQEIFYKYSNQSQLNSIIMSHIEKRIQVPSNIILINKLGFGATSQEIFHFKPQKIHRVIRYFVLNRIRTI
jgi:hypothetical protein